MLHPDPAAAAQHETQETLDLFIPVPSAVERLTVRKRDGRTVPFDDQRIVIALEAAFRDVLGLPRDAALSAEVRQNVKFLTAGVVDRAVRLATEGRELEVELIQDLVENELMRAGQHAVARSYILYREERRKARLLRSGDAADAELSAGPRLLVTLPDGTTELLDPSRVRRALIRACAGFEDRTDWREMAEETLSNLYDGVRLDELEKAMLFAAKARVERDPAYSFVAARLLLNTIYKEVLPDYEETDTAEGLAARHRAHFADYLRRGVDLGRLDSSLLTFDLDRIAGALRLERDERFNYMGMQTVYDRYLIHDRGRRLESPQYFWMRVSMGLAVLENEQKHERAVEFYELLSSMRFCSSTPTLFNSGTLHPQLSSCYLSTVMDDLEHIFKVVSDDARLSKWAGGLGNDWTNVRATGAHIRGTNGESQGVVPFLKVANDTAVAVNQCFPPGTKVWTNAGPKVIEAIVPGDLVLGIDAEYRPVTEVMEYPQHEPMVELRLKHASGPVHVTAGHPLLAIQGVPMETTVERAHAWFDKGKIRMAWAEAGQLRRGDYVAQVIPSETVNVPGFTADDARFYGLMLGDGHQTSNRYEWGLCFNAETNRDSLAFAENYLRERGIPFHASARGCYRQLKWSTARTNPAAQLPFSHDDLYDEARRKRIAPRLAHLPRPQTLELLRGLIETDGNVSRGTEITFSNTSEPLVEGFRYQMLRLGVPTAARRRTRRYERDGLRSDGSAVRFAGVSTEWIVPVPAVAELAALIGCRPLTKFNWLRIGHFVFTRVRHAASSVGVPLVYDLKVEGVKSYTTTAALAHNGGKRKGAMCAYLETWHLDIEDFLELRKNTGDERRRTHDMNTANWIPDLFLKRVIRNEHWTLLNPSDCPDLHDLYGRAFEQRYLEYEAAVDRGEIKLHRRVEALTLWRKMLTMLFETGHPWLTFKDPSNLRSPQDHVGVVHNSNLCTEILLNTSKEEVAVCNLGSINLAEHVVDGRFDADLLATTVRTAMRMLDNVIDINYYPIPEARTANLRHRPVGLGFMGFQDALYKLGISYASDAAVEFSDRSMELISYHAILSSTELARERGAYPTFKGSKWDRGLLPIDTVELLADERGAEFVDMDRSQTLDWDRVRAAIAQHGMRNSNCMAIAPTATISNISGVSQSIEPAYKHLFSKSNLSGDFATINSYLVEDLKRLDLWDEDMVADLKYYDGTIQEIDRIPAELKEIYRTAFEIEPRWLIECASRRQKWIDMGQSLNLYLAGPSGKKLSDMYQFAWSKGLKTTYYLRTLAATQIEKSTLDVNRRGNQPRWMKNRSASAGVQIARQPAAPAAAVPTPQTAPTPLSTPAPAVTAAPDDVTLAPEPATAVKACSILDPGCESCQ